MTVRELKEALKGVADDIDVTIYLPKDSMPENLKAGIEFDLTLAKRTFDADALEVFRLSSDQFAR